MALKFDKIWIDGGGSNVRAIGQRGNRKTNLFTIKAGVGSVQTAVRRASRYSTPNGELVVGLRGAWTSTEKTSWKRRLTPRGRFVRVISDIELAHEMSFPEGIGIVLNAGTGSIAYGRNANGKTVRAGGLGPHLGDDGSAFWIGREYIRRVERHTRNFSDLRRLAVSANPVAAIADRARLAFNAARRGGEAARILDEARTALCQLVWDVQRKLGNRRLPVVFQGGLFKNDRFRRSLETIVQRRQKKGKR